MSWVASRWMRSTWAGLPFYATHESITTSCS